MSILNRFLTPYTERRYHTLWVGYATVSEYYFYEYETGVIIDKTADDIQGEHIKAGFFQLR